MGLLLPRTARAALMDASGAARHRKGRGVISRKKTVTMRAVVFLGASVGVLGLIQALSYMFDKEPGLPERAPAGREPQQIVALINGNKSDCNSAFDTTAGPVFYLIGELYCFLGLAIVCDEYFVESLDAISNFLHLSEDVAGATFMAAGSSAPELCTAIITILISPGDEGLGTIVGSAVFNIMVIVGLTAIFAGQTLDLWWYPLLRDSFVYAISCLQLTVFIAVTTVGYIDWWEALILIITYGGYLIWMVLNDKIVKFLGEVELNRQRRKKLERKQKEKEKADADAEEEEKRKLEELLDKSDALGSTDKDNKEKDTGDLFTPSWGLTKWGSFRKSKVAPEDVVPEETMSGYKSNPASRPGSAGVKDGALAANPDGEEADKADGTENPDGTAAEGAAAAEDGAEGGLNDDDAAAAAPAPAADGDAAAAGDSEVPLEDPEEERARQEAALGKINNIFAKSAAEKAAGPKKNPLLGLLGGSQPAGDAAAPVGAQEEAANIDPLTGKEVNPFAHRRGMNPMLKPSGKKGWSLHGSTDAIRQTEREEKMRQIQMKFTTAIVVESAASKWLAKIGKRRSTMEEIETRRRAEEEEMEAEEEEEEQTLLGKIQEKAIWLLSLPYIIMMKFTIPDCRKPMFKKWFMLTFIMSIAWIGILSYFMVEFGSRLGCIFGIPSIIMGLTILAAGTSVPDALSSIVVAQNGQGDMAVANVLGSNVFNILVGLGVPWMIAILIKLGDSFEVNADGVTEPVIILFMYLLLFIGVIMLAKWRLFPAMGYILISMYFLFVFYSVVTGLFWTPPWK